MRKQYSGPFQAKLTWMTPALQLLELLMSTLKNACLWNMQYTPTLSSTTMCQQADCTFDHFLSSFSHNAVLSHAEERPAYKKKLPNLNYVITGTSQEHYFFCESITNYNLKCSCLERSTNAAWRTPSLAPENVFFFSLLSFCSQQMNFVKINLCNFLL